MVESVCDGQRGRRKIWSGRRVICCPRAYPSIDGITSFDMASPPGCDASIAELRCGTWYEGRTVALPECYFKLIADRLLGGGIPPETSSKGAGSGAERDGSEVEAKPNALTAAFRLEKGSSPDGRDGVAGSGSRAGTQRRRASRARPEGERPVFDALGYPYSLF